jgi:hypothetical protein
VIAPFHLIAKAKFKTDPRGIFMNNQATSRSEDRRMLTGMFRDKDSTEGAYRSLRERGYTDDEINVMMSDETRDKYFSTGDTELEGNKALEGTGAGAAIGGTLGAIIGGIAAIGTNVLIPGLGLVVWGPIAAGLPEQARVDLPVDWSVH